MTEAGSAEFVARARFDDIPREAKRVVAALRQIQRARERASGKIEIGADTSGLREEVQRETDAATEGVDSEVEVKSKVDASGFRRGLKKALTAAERESEVQVAVHADTSGLGREVEGAAKKERGNAPPITLRTEAEPVRGSDIPSPKPPPEPVKVPVEPKMDGFARAVARGIRAAEARQDAVKISTDVDQSGLEAGLRRLQVTTAKGRFTIEVPAALKGDDLAREVAAKVREVEARADPIDVPIRPEVSRFGAAVAKAVRDAEARADRVTIDTEVDQSGLQEGVRRVEVTTRSGKYRITVPAELKGEGLAREVERLIRETEARTGSIDVPVDADGRGLRRKVSALTKAAGAGQVVKVKVEADGKGFGASLRNALSSAGGAGGGSFLSSLTSLLAVPAIVTGLSLIGGAIAAITTAAAGAASALGPLVGLLGAIPSAAAVVAGVVGSVTLAFRGVGDALKAYGAAQDKAASRGAAAAKTELANARQREAALRRLQKAQEGVGDAQRRAIEVVVQAQRRLAAAELSLEAAQKRSLRAQVALTAARREAAKDLRDLRLQVEGNALAEQQAVLDLARARERLNEVNSAPDSTSNDRTQALLDVQQAELDLREIQNRRADDQERLTDAEAKGVEQSDRVVAAREDQADATRGVLDAQTELTDAQAGLADAQVQAVRLVRDANDELAQALEAVADAAQSAASGGVDEFAAALGKLPPSAQAFVRYLLTLQPLLDRLQRTAADNLFPGLIIGLKAAVGLFPIANALIAIFSRAVGNAAAQLGKLTLDPRFREDLAAVGVQGAGAFVNLAQAIDPVIRAIASVGHAAGPLVDWLSKIISYTAALYAGQLDAAASSGRLAGLFRETQFVVDSLGRAFGGLVRGLVEIGKIAYDVIGRQFVGNIREGARTFADWTKSVEGQNSIRRFFEDAKPVIHETWLLLRDVVALFFGLGRNKDLAGLISQLRTEFLPVLKDILKNANAAFGPALISLLSSAAALFERLGGASGPLNTFVTVLAKMLDTFVWLLDTIPGLKEVLTVLGTFLAVGRALSVIKWFTGIGQIVDIVKGLGPVLAAAKTAFSTLGTAAVGAIRSIGAALIANPWILVIVAVIAAIALLIWKWDAVKKFLLDTWEQMARGAERIWGAISSVFSTIWTGIQAAVSTGLGWLRSMFGGALDWISDKWNRIWGGLTSGLGAVWDRIKGLVQAGVNGVIWILNGLIKGANWILSKLPGGFKIPEISPVKFSKGGQVGGGRDGDGKGRGGGLVGGRGRRDTELALLTPGEFVITRDAVARIGVRNLEAMNRAHTTATDGGIRATGGALPDGSFVMSPEAVKAIGVERLQDLQGIGARPRGVGDFWGDVGDSVRGTIRSAVPSSPGEAVGDLLNPWHRPLVITLDTNERLIRKSDDGTATQHVAVESAVKVIGGIRRLADTLANPVALIQKGVEFIRDPQGTVGKAFGAVQPGKISGPTQELLVGVVHGVKGARASSVLRSAQQNVEMGGSENSAHVQGKAVDFTGPVDQITAFLKRNWERFRLAQVIARNWVYDSGGQRRYPFDDHQDHVHAQVLHTGGVAGAPGVNLNRDLLTLLQRGEGVVSVRGMANLQAALADPVVVGSGQTPAPVTTEVNVEINNPKAETSEESLHRTFSKLAAHGLLAPLQEAP